MTVTLVCGPPCSGKTTYVEQHAAPDAVVVCHDRYAYQAGSPALHGHSRYHRDCAEARVAGMFRRISDGELRGSEVWVVRTLPRVEDRAAMVRRLGVTELVLMVEPREVLYRRARARVDAEHTIRQVDRWYAAYDADTAARAATPRADVAEVQKNLRGAVRS